MIQFLGYTYLVSDEFLVRVSARGLSEELAQARQVVGEQTKDEADLSLAQQLHQSVHLHLHLHTPCL